jgi:hypothetical protein
LTYGLKVKEGLLVRIAGERDLLDEDGAVVQREGIGVIADLPGFPGHLQVARVCRDAVRSAGFDPWPIPPGIEPVGEVVHDGVA